MKERPIIFSGEMVNAILGGHKTQTRRVIKPQPESITEGLIEPTGKAQKRYPGYPWVICPYGAPGDRLWVRESWAHNKDKSLLWYRADYPCTIPMYATKLFGGTNWRSPIHMPRWASRITLEITDVRAERIQEMTFHDLQAEGMQGELTKAVKDYSLLWDSLNGKRGYAWNRNPWVWVIEFRKVTS